MRELFNCRTIFEDLRITAHQMNGQLSYLFATGSSESCLRDALAYQLHTKHVNVAREYWIRCNGSKRRADIAVLSQSGPEPEIILELKHLYLKDLYRSGLRQPVHASDDDTTHPYVSNIVNDVTDRRSACSDVYGVIFVRRIQPGAMLPCVNDFAHSIYVKEDLPFVSNGIERMHKAIAKLACKVDYWPTTWQDGQILPPEQSRSGIELYAWVIRAA